MTVGGIDTYYDYEDRQWKSRRLGGGPIRRGPVCPSPRQAEHLTSDRRGQRRDHDQSLDLDETPGHEGTTVTA
jgi:hypothetical protein